MNPESYIAEQFRKLVEKYEADKASADVEDGDKADLLDTLVSELVAEGADYWYSSSSNC